MITQIGSGLGVGLVKLSDGTVYAWHNGDMNGRRAFVIFDTTNPSGELFVFMSNANKGTENGFTLLGDTPFSTMDIGPLRTYLREKYGFALDIREEDWQEKQSARFQRTIGWERARAIVETGVPHTDSLLTAVSIFKTTSKSTDTTKDDTPRI